MVITPVLNLVKLCIIRSFLKFFCVINLGPSCVDSLAVSLLTRAKLKNCGVTLRLSSKQPDLAVVRSSSRLFHLLSCSVMCCLSESRRRATSGDLRRRDERTWRSTRFSLHFDQKAFTFCYFSRARRVSAVIKVITSPCLFGTQCCSILVSHPRLWVPFPFREKGRMKGRTGGYSFMGCPHLALGLWDWKHIVLLLVGG